MTNNDYILISACRNEADNIEGLIESVTCQTNPPSYWVIVDDGSMDDTYQCATSKCCKYDYIEVIKVPTGRPRSFASQVYASQYGYENIRCRDSTFIGFLDADIRIQPQYYERLCHYFSLDSKLGLAGGIVMDQYSGRTSDVRRGSEDYHVAGGVQFFRRECFETIGGYIAVESGGQDTIADIMVLMNGWIIHSFPELVAIHLRPEGTLKENVFRQGMKWGKKFYLIGYHPLYFLCQALKRLTNRPILIGSVCQLLGFIRTALSAPTRPVSDDFVAFLHRLQMTRIKKYLRLPY